MSGRGTPAGDADLQSNTALAYIHRNGGARTFRIARELGVPTSEARKLLKKLERDGMVYRDQHRCAPNDLFWCFKAPLH